MSRPLKMFMRGKSVTMLQELLRRMGYPVQDQPGLFGVYTRDAVKDYQRQRGLKTTGVVDAELLQQMQQGHVASPDTPEKREETASDPVQRQRLDALIRLLIRKEIITGEELQAEIRRPEPLSTTRPPLT